MVPKAIQQNSVCSLLYCHICSCFPSVLTDIIQRNAEFMLTDLTIIIIIIIVETVV